MSGLVAWIERTIGDRGREVAELLAHHFGEAATGLAMDATRPSEDVAELAGKAFSYALIASNELRARLVLETAARMANVAVCARHADQVTEAVAALRDRGVRATGAAVDITDGPALKTWILLLAGAQAADVFTTWVDMEHGGVEANRIVSSLLGVGGLGLVFFLKLLLVVAMGIACLLVKRYADSHPSFSARAAHAFVWRAMQLSVVGLVLVALHNAAVLAQIG